jgi:hypothetical protein
VRGAERFERPRIDALVVTQDVKIAVGRPNAEIDSPWRIPAVFDFRDFKRAPTKLEP